MAVRAFVTACALFACALGVAACQDSLSNTAVVLKVYVDPMVGWSPDALDTEWLDDRGRVLPTKRVPDRGRLPDVSPVAVIFYEVPAPVTGSLVRRALVHGLVDGETRMVGFGRYEIMPDKWLVKRLDLFPVADVRDRDKDGVPDEIDVCPGNDLEGCAPESGDDAGTLVDAAVDGGVDTGGDAPLLDAATKPDAPGDVGIPDARVADAPRG